MRLLAVLLVLCPTFLAAAEPSVAEIAARRAWVWFGVSEAAARSHAASAGQAITVVWRNGTPAADVAAGVQVAILDGVVIEARDNALVEGCRESALLPLLGVSEVDATAAAQRLQRPVRVVWRDGNGLPATMDYSEERLNLHVSGGIVVAISGG